jgi:hypothetical protein
MQGEQNFSFLLSTNVHTWAVFVAACVQVRFVAASANARFVQRERDFRIICEDGTSVAKALVSL